MSHIHVCTGRSCREKGSGQVLKTIRDAKGEQAASGCKCLGYCEQAANLLVDDCIIHKVTSENVFDKLNNTSDHKLFREQVGDVRIDDDFLGDLGAGI